MALANVLSAMREIILEDMQLSADAAIRLETFKHRYPGLSSIEVEDLARIPPQQIKIYTKTIFSGEAAVIRQHFPITIALLSQVWKKIFGHSFDTSRFAKSLHIKQPWKGYLTETLCRNVVTYLKTDAMEVRRVVPCIGDVATLEMLAFGIARSPNEQWIARNSIQREALASLTVDEMLERDFIVPKNTVFQIFQFDVLSLSQFFYSHKRSLPDRQLQRAKTTLAGGRDQLQGARFVHIEEMIAAYLQDLPRGERTKVSEFADVFLNLQTCLNLDETSARAEQEKELFFSFVQLIVQLMDTGAIVFPG